MELGQVRLASGSLFRGTYTLDCTRLCLRKSSMWDLSKINIPCRIGYAASIDLKYIPDLLGEDVMEEGGRGEVEWRKDVSRD